MSEKLTKADVLTAIASKTGLPKTQVTAVLEATTEVVTETITQGKSLPLIGGIFKPVERAARTGRNPQTGESVAIPASRGVSFKPGTGLKSELN